MMIFALPASADLNGTMTAADKAAFNEMIRAYIEKNPEIFKSGALVKFKGMSHHRWTLDEPEDFKLLSFIFNELYEKDSIFYTHQIIKLLEINPEISNINSNIIRNKGYQNSLLAEGSSRYET